MKDTLNYHVKEAICRIKDSYFEDGANSELQTQNSYQAIQDEDEWIQDEIKRKPKEEDKIANFRNEYDYFNKRVDIKLLLGDYQKRHSDELDHYHLFVYEDQPKAIEGFEFKEVGKFLSKHVLKEEH